MTRRHIDSMSLEDQVEYLSNHIDDLEKEEERLKSRLASTQWHLDEKDKEFYLFECSASERLQVLLKVIYKLSPDDLNALLIDPDPKIREATHRFKIRLKPRYNAEDYPPNAEAELRKAQASGTLKDYFMHRDLRMRDLAWRIWQEDEIDDGQ